MTKRGPAKLDRQTVIAIKNGLAHGIEGATLARLFGVTRSTISRIKRGSRWSEVKSPTNQRDEQ